MKLLFRCKATHRGRERHISQTTNRISMEGVEDGGGNEGREGVKLLIRDSQFSLSGMLIKATITDQFRIYIANEAEVVAVSFFNFGEGGGSDARYSLAEKRNTKVCYLHPSSKETVACPER